MQRVFCQAPSARWRLVAVAAASLMALPSIAGAGDPSRQWHTITTPHFRVHYYKNRRHDLGQLAQRVAVRAEKAHAVLVRLLRHAPSSPTDILLSDDVDGANGSAQFVPRNIVRLYATAPDPHSSMGDYDDWIYGLFTHEYTHILHMDTIHGLPRVVNAILGKHWVPNNFQPPWIIEGLATFEESERTSGGRVRGTIFDMLLRTAVLEGKMLRLDQISSSTRRYPQGVARYLYGCRFVKYIADRFGEEKLTRMSHIYGRRPLPYAINRVAQEVLGHTLVELYGDFRRHLERHYGLQRAEAARRGLTRFEKVTDHGEMVTAVRYSPDGSELLFVEDDGRSRRSQIVLDARTGRRKERHRDHGGNGATITPDGRHIVHAQRGWWRTIYDFPDLFVLDRRTRERRRLTRGLRARDPDVSPDGREVVFVTNDLGKHNLVLIPFAGGAPRVLLRGGRDEQMAAPRFGPQGKLIAFSRWTPGGYRDIYVFDRSAGKVERVTADRAEDLDPVFSADGQRIYFSSDRTGIFNIYCYERGTRRLSQVTNVVGGALWPAVDRAEKTLFYVGFSAKGYDLHRADLDRTRFLPALPYVDSRPPPVKIEEPSAPFAVKRYSPWQTILPVRWMFAVGSDAYGTTLGIELDGGDVVGHHRYIAAANVSTVKGYPSYAVNYIYDRFWPALRLDTSRSEGPRGGLSVDGERLTYLEQGYGGGINIDLPVLRIPDHSIDLSLGYRLRWYRASEGTTDVLVEPDMVSPQMPPTGRYCGVTFGARYQNALDRHTYSVSTESGRLIAFNVTVDDESLGSEVDGVQVSWSWAEYLRMPWLERHVLALRLAGGVARGGSSRRGPFFVGGFPEQNIIDTVIELAPLGGAYLRGYPPGAFFGDQYHLLNVEYRAPLFEIERGISSLPLYVNHLHLAVFSDVGHAFYDEFKAADLKVGVGAELLLEWQIFYIQPFTLRLGYGRGLMEKGGNEFHFLLANRF